MSPPPDEAGNPSVESLCAAGEAVGTAASARGTGQGLFEGFLEGNLDEWLVHSNN